MRVVDRPPNCPLAGCPGQVEKPAGEIIITQGSDEVDNFYVVASGVCKCYQGAMDDAGLVDVCESGNGFGELALMYGGNRKASVRAETDVMLWALDRSSFKALLMQAALDRRKSNLDFLDVVPVFGTLDRYYLYLVADAMELVTYEDGQVIINQGDKSDDFFVVNEGEVVVSQVHDAAGTPEPEPEPAVEGEGPVDGGALVTLHRGEYFGCVLTKKSRTPPNFYL